MICRTLRAFASLAEDAAEALIELAFTGTKRTADDLWERATIRDHADRLAEVEERMEVWEPACCDKCGGKLMLWHDYDCQRLYEEWHPESSVAAPKVSADPAATESPAPPSRDTDVVGAGHPSLTKKDELRDLAEAARCFAPHWYDLSEKTFRIAHSMK